MIADGDDDVASAGGDALTSLFINLPAILLQRKWLIAATTIVFALAGVAGAYLWPPTYRSKAVLLVESAQIQSAKVGELSPEVIDQRIAKVRQQVLSRPDLLAIVQELQLYPRDRANSQFSDIVEKMRKAIVIEPVSAQIQQQSATIAFSMSFDYTDAEIARNVTQRLVERVLEVDSTRSAENAEDKVRFLKQQADQTQTKMAAVQQEIAAIKGRNGSVLSSTGTTFMDASPASYDGQIAALERDRSQMRAQRETAQSSATRDPIVAAAEAQLAALRATYAEQHPDVVLARQRLAEAKELAARTVKNLPLDVLGEQIAQLDRQIADLRAARGRAVAQTTNVLSAQSRAPLVQEQVAQLQSGLTVLDAQYTDTASKLREATSALELENQQKGDRLALVDPPVAEKDPVFPNRPLVMGLAAALGVLLGVGLAVGYEFMIRPIRGPVAAARAAGAALLGALPTAAVPRVRRGWRPFRKATS